MTNPDPLAARNPVCLEPDAVDIRLVLNAELPTCPFCNGTPTTFARYFEHSGIYQSYVNCSRCHAQIFVNSRDREDARDQAMAAWSKRAALAPQWRAPPEKLRADLDDLGYTKVFHAIVDAVNLPYDGAIGISVEKLIFGLTGVAAPTAEEPSGVPE